MLSNWLIVTALIFVPQQGTPWLNVNQKCPSPIKILWCVLIENFENGSKNG